MDSANGFTCAICRDSICCDSEKSKSIDLTCGHAFGKTCMRKWVESTNQKKCFLCENPLTDIEINEIKNIPLQKRVIIFSEKAIKLSGQAILKLVPPFPAETAAVPLIVATGAAGGATVGTIVAANALTGTIVGAATGAVAGAAAGVAAGDVGAAAGGINSADGRAVTGTVRGVAATIGASALTLGVLGIAEDFMSTPEAVGAAAVAAGGAAGVAAGAFAVAASELGFNAKAVVVAVLAAGVTVGVVETVGAFRDASRAAQRNAGLGVVALDAFDLALTIGTLRAAVEVLGYFVGAGMGALGTYIFKQTRNQ